MKYLYRFVFILIPIFMIGCPLASKYPLGESRTAPMDQRYIGKWVTAESTDKQYLLILPFNENEYLIEIFNNEDVERYRAFSTIIDNVDILNLQPITVKEKQIVPISERKYIFFKILLSDNNILTLWNIKREGTCFCEEDFKEDYSKEELFRYIQKNIGNDNVYEMLEELKKDAKN